MKSKLNLIFQNRILVAGLALCLAGQSYGQSNPQQKGPPPGPPPGHHGPGDMYLFLCAGQHLQGVTLPVPPARPSDEIRSKIDAAIQACAAQLPAPPADSDSTSDSNSTPE